MFYLFYFAAMKFDDLLNEAIKSAFRFPGRTTHTLEHGSKSRQWPYPVSVLVVSAFGAQLFAKLGRINPESSICDCSGDCYSQRYRSDCFLPPLRLLMPVSWGSTGQPGHHSDRRGGCRRRVYARTLMALLRPLAWCSGGRCSVLCDV